MEYTVCRKGVIKIKAKIYSEPRQFTNQDTGEVIDYDAIVIEGSLNGKQTKVTVTESSVKENKKILKAFEYEKAPTKA